MDLISLHDGRLIQVHDEGTCALSNCVIHAPSAHPLATAPLHWRDDRALFERICPHGVGHPDPDAIAADILLFGYDLRDRGIHNCDGCCS